MVDSKELEKTLEKYYKSLGLKNVEKHVEKRLRRERSKYVISFLKNKLNLENLEKLVVLDVGAGWGEFLQTLKEEKADIYGIEPDQLLVNLTNKLLGRDAVFQGYAEALPFENNKFDIVICNDTLEHVVNHSIALSEIIRVTKQGGYIWLEFPNYAYPQESHYKTFFIPFAPKLIGSIYLSLIGRNPSFWKENVNPTYYKKIRRILSIFDLEIEEVQNDLYPLRGGTFKIFVKKLYIKFFGPPVICMVIRKKSSGLKSKK